MGELTDHALLAHKGVDGHSSLTVAAGAKDTLGPDVLSSLFLGSVSFLDLRGN